ALADAGDVDALSGVEHVGGDHLPDLVAREVVDAHLREVARRLGTGPRKVPRLRLAQSRLLRRAVRELHRGVAVTLGCLQLHDTARPGLDDRDRDDAMLPVTDLGHSELAPEDAFGSHVRRRLSREFASREPSPD